jgi:hypothetical protein
MMIAAFLLLAGVHHHAPEVDWHRVATAADRERLRGWRDDWQRSLAAARAGDGAATIAADPVLFDPDAALDAPTPPAATYRCRVTKFAGRHLAVEAWSRCSVAASGALLRLQRLEGDQRFDGLIYADGTHRSIFLGTASYPQERRTVTYGRASGRDMIGRVERIGAQRWRVVLPSPRYESQLDLVELVPAD